MNTLTDEKTGASHSDDDASADASDDDSEDEEDSEDISDSDDEEPRIRRLMSRVPHPECSGGYHVGVKAHSIGSCLPSSLIVGGKTIPNPVAMTIFVSTGLSMTYTKSI